MHYYDISTLIVWILLGCFCLLLGYDHHLARRLGPSGLRRVVLRLALCCIFSLTAFFSGSMWRESFEIRSQLYFTGLDILGIGLLFCIPAVFFAPYHFSDRRFSLFSLTGVLGAQIFFLLSMTLTHLFDGWITALASAALLFFLSQILQHKRIWRPGPGKGLSAACMLLCGLNTGKGLAALLEDSEGTALLLFCACAGFFAGMLLQGVGKEEKAAQNGSLAFSACAMVAALSCGPLAAVRLG